MRRVIQLGVMGAAAGILLACSYDPELVDTTEVVLHELDAVRAMEPQAPPSTKDSRSGYLDYTDVMGEEYDRTDYWHFAFKAVDLAKGEPVTPDPCGIPQSAAGQCRGAVGRPRAADGGMEQTGRKKAPLPAARAQTAFDCWLEKAEENDPAEQIAVCKGAFEDAIAEVERR